MRRVIRASLARVTRESEIPIVGLVCPLRRDPGPHPGRERSSESRVTYGYIVVAAECNYIVRANARNAPGE